ncbi:MAG: 1,4-dihydroxy-2-naphthoate octaprenyltransferase [Bacteroidales bacterium]|nr:1,4-dihydroxy-2-naphthoate octaprenyltransferase [Bacteroidales bacterium]
MGEVKQNSLKAWILAARPKTLAGAAAPVFVGWALALFFIKAATPSFREFLWLPAILSLLFALLMQIDANLINDYFDFKKGTDTEERLGPERACAQGWITLPAMRLGIIIVTTLAALVGLPLIFFGGRPLAFVGIACILGAFLYTTYLSYRGWGDFMVVIFFGVVPVFFTQYVITGGGECYRGFMPAAAVLLAGLAVGFVTDNLLVVNNYRDRETDSKTGKKTIIVSLGAKAGERLYLFNGIVGILLASLSVFILNICYSEWQRYLIDPRCFIPFLFLPFLLAVFFRMVKIKKGRALNAVLGATSRNILIFSILLIIALLFITPLFCVLY